MQIAVKFSRQDRLYTVGIEQHDDRGEVTWCGFCDCETLGQVMQLISYLHGGTRPGFLDR